MRTFGLAKGSCCLWNKFSTLEDVNNFYHTKQRAIDLIK